MSNDAQIGFTRVTSPQWLSRLALGLAALEPALVWILARQPLAQSQETGFWSIVTACAVAVVPWPMVGAVMLLVCLPLTLTWIGCVLVTGSGPTFALVLAAATASPAEVGAAVSEAALQPSFVLLAALQVLLIGMVLAWGRRVQDSRRGWIPPVFAILLGATLFVRLAPDFGYARALGWMSPESWRSVVWLSHIDVLRAATQEGLERWTYGGESFVRDGRRAPANFHANPGLAVFVLGESLRADALAVPARGPWSKGLIERLDRGMGMRLADACASANVTAIAVPRLLTMADPADERTARQGQTLLAYAKAAGAYTAWISVQETLLVKEAGHDVVQQLSSSAELGPYDDVAVLALRQFAATTRAHPARSALVHLLGQHFHYADRYPPDLFAPEPDGLSPDERETLRYHRAAEFGAKTLLEIASVLDAESNPAYAVFTSDHGENLVSDGHHKKFHAGVPGQLDTRVPTLVLWNEAFAATGLTKLLAPFRQADLVAHRDVARLWLALAGSPGEVLPTPHPTTWSGPPRGEIPCAELGP